MRPMGGNTPPTPPTPPAPPADANPGGSDYGWRFDPAELADLYAAGALSVEEQRELDDRISKGDSAMVREIQRAEPIIRNMLEAFEPVDPPARIIRGVMEQIGAPTSTDEPLAASPTSPAPTRIEALAGSVLRRIGEERWLPTGLPGVWSRVLYKSKRENRVSMLVKCEPGAYIPHHEHAGIEELIVLEGDLIVGGNKLLAGDYIRTEPGQDHGDAHSEGGCVCLFFTSYGVMSNRTKLSMLGLVVRRFFNKVLGR